MAQRVLAEKLDSDEARVARIFRLSLARSPEPGELATLMKYFRAQQAAFEQEPSASPSPIPGAWAAVSRVIMNLDEFITRE